jgi:hypothetical protein
LKASFLIELSNGEFCGRLLRLIPSPIDRVNYQTSLHRHRRAKHLQHPKRGHEYAVPLFWLLERMRFFYPVIYKFRL